MNGWGVELFSDFSSASGTLCSGQNPGDGHDLGQAQRGGGELDQVCRGWSREPEDIRSGSRPGRVEGDPGSHSGEGFHPG